MVLRQLRPLIIGFLLLGGYVQLHESRTERFRAAQVRIDADKIVIANLAGNGWPQNRHVAVTDARACGTPVIESYPLIGRWTTVFVPLTSGNNNIPNQVRAVACFHDVHDEAALQARVKKVLTGYLWNESQLLRFEQIDLEAANPGVSFAGAVVIECGIQPPSRLTADSRGIVAVIMIMLGCLVALVAILARLCGSVPPRKPAAPGFTLNSLPLWRSMSAIVRPVVVGLVLLIAGMHKFGMWPKGGFDVVMNFLPVVAIGGGLLVLLAKPQRPVSFGPDDPFHMYDQLKEEELTESEASKFDNARQSLSLYGFERFADMRCSMLTLEKSFHERVFVSTDQRTIVCVSGIGHTFISVDATGSMFLTCSNAIPPEMRFRRICVVGKAEPNLAKACSTHIAFIGSVRQAELAMLDNVIGVLSYQAIDLAASVAEHGYSNEAISRMPATEELMTRDNCGVLRFTWSDTRLNPKPAAHDAAESRSLELVAT